MACLSGHGQSQPQGPLLGHGHAENHTMAKKTFYPESPLIPDILSLQRFGVLSQQPACSGFAARLLVCYCQEDYLAPKGQAAAL